jgi:regulator of sirC expression with transglutaminase-like and TPR domain
MTRCRVSEDELAHDHAQVEITPEMEREEAREEFEALMEKVTNMAEVLLQDWRFHPDYDDLEAVKHLHQHLNYYW